MFDWITWSIWLIGLIILIIWIIVPLREYKQMMRAKKERDAQNEE